MAERAPDDRVVALVTYPAFSTQADVSVIEAVDTRVRLVVCDYIESHELRTLREQDPFGDAVRAAVPALSAEQRAAFAEAEVVLGLDVPVDLAEVAPRLRWVQNLGSGVGQYVAARLPDAGIVLTNAVGVGAGPIAEFVMARVLAHAKRLAEMAELQRRHAWEPAFGRLVAGRTMAVVGLGAIGGEVARRARAFDVHVLGIRRSWTPGATDERVDELFGPDALHEVLGRADWVVLAAPGTAATESLFDASAFAAMRPGALFVNVARGTLVDEDALVDALHRGHLGGAALDVFREEPLPPSSPLWDVPGLEVSPHSSASQEGYMARVVDLFCDNLRRYLDGQPLRNVVDPGLGY